MDKARIFFIAFALAVFTTASCSKVVDDYDNLSNATEISGETANCYIVSQRGPYKFKTVKGNSSESVGAVAEAEVIWESYGSNYRPARGSLISKVAYSNGYIAFSATPRKGNALIAAKDAAGNILWSWHIWLTDEPAVQHYSKVGVYMMDRNLGATSTLEGSAESLGLLYQWGRKDPFLGSSNTVNPEKAGSTISWPAAVNASEVASGGNALAYSIANPTTFIQNGYEPYDWYTADAAGGRADLWAEAKTIYDPCPPGYRVPTGGDSGVWATAFGSAESFTDADYVFSDSEYKGVDFKAAFGTDDACWYPACGYCYRYNGVLDHVGFNGNYWSCSSTGLNIYSSYFFFASNGYGNPSENAYRASGHSVRCCQDSVSGSLILR